MVQAAFLLRRILPRHHKRIGRGAHRLRSSKATFKLTFGELDRIVEMTGMEKSKASFQALSSFSGTGFTTREAELIVNHPRRRKVVMYLMILGNAGLVSVIATLVLSLRKTSFFGPSLNLAIIAVVLFILYRVATYQKFVKRLTEKISTTLKERLHFEDPVIQELLQRADGYGVAMLLIGLDSKVVGKTLIESGLKEIDAMVLSVERDDEVISVPKASVIIQSGDRLTCYGKLENLKEII